MESFEELKQIIKDQQDKRNQELLSKMNINGIKHYNSVEDINNLVDSILGDIPEKSEEELRKNIINLKEINKDGCVFGITTTKSEFQDFKNMTKPDDSIPIKAIYKSYVIINKDDDILDNLFCKQFQDEKLATNYYEELVELVQNSTLNDIFKKIKDNL